MKSKSLSNSYLSVFCTELAMLLQSGITFGDGILMLMDDEPTRDGKAVLQSLSGGETAGESISAVFRESNYFPRYMVSMVEIGERTGRLVETLEALSAHYNRRDRMSTVIKNAVLYPAILLILMVAVVLILIIRVLPIFNEVFSSLGSQMSALAVNLMRFGRWLGDVSAVIAAIVGIVVVIALLSWLIPPLRRAIAGCFRSVFGGRGVWSRISSAHFTSALALASASGLDTEEALDMASAISGGVKSVDERHAKCRELLRDGKTLSEAMSAARLISSRDSRMLSIGIRSGMEDRAMADIAQRNNIGVQDEIDRLIGRIEPALVIITSVIIGIILLSVMLPLMGIMSSIG